MAYEFAISLKDKPFNDRLPLKEVDEMICQYLGVVVDKDLYCQIPLLGNWKDGIMYWAMSKEIPMSNLLNYFSLKISNYGADITAEFVNFIVWLVENFQFHYRTTDGRWTTPTN